MELKKYFDIKVVDIMIKKRKKLILSCFFVIILMLIIFNFSSMNTNESNGKSKGIIYSIVEVTNEISNKLGITDNILTEEEKINLTEKLNLPLRKGMHFFIYFILSFLIFNTLNQTKINYKYLITIIICFIYALTDEYHQTFILGRTGQFSDVMIDTSGSILYLFIHNIIKKYYNKKR